MKTFYFAATEFTPSSLPVVSALRFACSEGKRSTQIWPRLSIAAPQEVNHEFVQELPPPRVYPHRDAGRHRHHRGVNRLAVAGRAEGSKRRGTRAVAQQPQA